VKYAVGSTTPKLEYPKRASLPAHLGKKFLKISNARFVVLAKTSSQVSKRSGIGSAAELMELIDEIGFLPLLDSGIPGFSAEEMVDDDCRYVVFDDGGWDWPLWKWKGQIVTDMPCFYGKFFNKKAGFISKEWWADFCNYRRSIFPHPSIDSIEGSILDTLRSTGSLITRELRSACGFNGKGMRSKFDGYITKLEMATYIVTEDFVYPLDKRGREYGWGWSLLNTPEALCGKDFCRKDCPPEASFEKLVEQFRKILPEATEKQILRLVG